MLLTSNMTASSAASISTTSVVNNWASASTSVAVSANDPNSRRLLSGALTANVFSQIVSVSGASGKLYLCALVTNNATARSIAIRVVVDGAYTMDFLSNSTSTANFGIIAVGSKSSADYLMDGEPIKFKTSLAISVRSSLTETDNITLLYKVMSEA